MNVSGSRYGFILSIQIILIIGDLLLNTFSIFFRDRVWYTVVFFAAHVLCLILALILLLVTFFSTYVFKVGLVEILVARFRCTIIVIVFYFILTCAYYVWTLIIMWVYSDNDNWGMARIGMFVAQRTGAPIYYYFYKRAALRISDPRFYEDIKWEQTQAMK